MHQLKCHWREVIDKASIIAMIDPFLKSNYYCFPKFADLYHGFAHPKFSIDMFISDLLLSNRVVVGVGFLEEYMTEPTNGNNDFTNHKICFFVCVAYGARAHVFQYLWNSTNANVVVGVLQL
ncbi:hypothetical protein HID58_063381 [Brassica napus]|uniref:Uncharacterized protein n=1 Tax=Brassica napus TaxID=3708 RepID=A0ABQ8A438_BRANA|nr:hypothetical protein HID58_063381 [Brassica napus]